MPETRSLHRKLAQVMYEAETIPKNGIAPKEVGGYRFVQVGDAADYIRKALAEKVITMMPVGVQVVGQADRPTKSGGNMTTVDLVTTWRLTDGESGESIEIQSFGAGADGGDKYSGKAMTSAMKYALLSGFLLSTGDDTERGGADGASKREPAHEGSLIGTARITDKTNSDGQLRQTPTGHRLGFRLESLDGDKGAILVEANDDLAVALATIREHWFNQRVTCWGMIEPREFTPANRAGKARTVPYQALVLSRMQTPTGTIPADDAANADAARGGVDQEPTAEPSAPLDPEIDALPLFDAA